MNTTNRVLVMKTGIPWAHIFTGHLITGILFSKQGVPCTPQDCIEWVNRTIVEGPKICGDRRKVQILGVVKPVEMLKIDLLPYKLIVHLSLSFLFTKNFDKVCSGILLPNLFWPTGRKERFRVQGKVLKFEAEGREFANVLRSVEQCLNNFW